MRRWLCDGVAAPVRPAAWADEEQGEAEGCPGRDKVSQNCVTCHSLDYIPLNSPFLDRKGWEATVTKMINAFHAPIAKDDVPVIVDYLTKNYGR